MGFVNESEFAPHSLFVSSNDKSSSSWNVTESYVLARTEAAWLLPQFVVIAMY